MVFFNTVCICWYEFTHVVCSSKRSSNKVPIRVDSLFYTNTHRSCTYVFQCGHMGCINRNLFFQKQNFLEGLVSIFCSIFQLPTDVFLGGLFQAIFNLHQDSFLNLYPSDSYHHSFPHIFHDIALSFLC